MHINYSYSKFDKNFIGCMHDKMIKDGYIYFIADNGMFFIYNEMFVFCDNEAGLWYLGDNILTCTNSINNDFEIFGAHKVIGFKEYKNDLMKIFGEMRDDEFSMTSEEFNREYDLI